MGDATLMAHSSGACSREAALPASCLNADLVSQTFCTLTVCVCVCVCVRVCVCRPACLVDAVVEGAGANGALYNGMVLPFVNMSIKGWNWYQGENNLGFHAGNVLDNAGYVCRQRI